jgi:hypothetical protein
MRHRGPHDDPPAKRRPARYSGPPVTLGHIRSHGVRRLLIYCSSGRCHHSATVNADRWPDETALRDLCPKAVCTRCGMIGADVRPNWSERPSTESMTRSGNRVTRSCHRPGGRVDRRGPKVVVADLGADADPFLLHLYAAFRERARDGTVRERIAGAQSLRN